MTEVDVRTYSQGGICTRRVEMAAVPGEVEYLFKTGKFNKVEIRVVGATTWMEVK